MNKMDRIIHTVPERLNRNEVIINRIEVLANDNYIKRQVPGITTMREKLNPSTPLKNQELFYRATMYRGS